ncbi:hypothetical protein IEQ34_004456 [Dendrobium chrysotoxum]|uniref:Uncharacterized protein n=1 Tax=Dendrobium chrysotoxum TaxID=161865 RepID=A0AAV7HGS0_DENCH|nr:hypothetical protein IEQ34_004456 [Dendrobium chrysotoxum]
MDDFWLRQGVALLLRLVNSSREDVQERVTVGLATFVVIDDKNAAVDPTRAEAIMKNGGISLLLELARSCREGVQSEVAKEIANLSVNAKVAKAITDEGGISILVVLTRSTNRLVVVEAVGGLWNLSAKEEHKIAIVKAGGVKALVDLIFKWPTGIDGVLECAAGALANMVADDRCSMEVAMACGVHALVILAMRACLGSLLVDATQRKKSGNLQTRGLVLQLIESILARPKSLHILINGVVRKGEPIVPPFALDLLMWAIFPVPSARVKVPTTSLHCRSSEEYRFPPPAFIVRILRNTGPSTSLHCQNSKEYWSFYFLHASKTEERFSERTPLVCNVQSRLNRSERSRPHDLLLRAYEKSWSSRTSKSATV